MKRHYLQYTVGGIGTIFVIAGLVWVCQKFVSTPRVSAQGPVRVSTAEAELSPSEIGRDIRFAEHQAPSDHLISGETEAWANSRSVQEPVHMKLQEIPTDEEPIKVGQAEPNQAEQGAFPALRFFDDKAAPLTREAPQALPQTSPQHLKEQQVETNNTQPFPTAPNAPQLPADPLANRVPDELPQSSMGAFPELPTPVTSETATTETTANAENALLPEQEKPLDIPKFVNDVPNTIDVPNIDDVPNTNNIQETLPAPAMLPSTSENPVSLNPATQASDPISSGIETKDAVQRTGNVTGHGSPGNKLLEGTQTASITLEKKLPAEVQVGRHETVTLILRNIGAVTAKNVQLRDLIPAKVSFISADPQATVTPDGTLVWEPFDLAAQQELEVNYIVVPNEEGELGSIASVSFDTEASGKTVCTRPLLKLNVVAPKEVLIGEKATFNIQVTNPGTGTATGVVLLEKVPTGLAHEGGKILDNQIGNIAPGETKELSLTMTATAPGKTQNHLSVSADNGLMEEVATEILVNSPELELEIAGSGLKYLGREATYNLKIHNPGSAPATDVKLIAELPKNMDFVRTNNLGQYDSSTHSVHWELVELPNNVAPGEIELVLLPKELGDGRLALHGEGAHDLACEVTENVQVDGLAALSFAVKSMTDPVEVGREATYEIQLSNRGTKASSNIHIVVDIPPTMKIVGSDGPTKLQQTASEVAFERLASLSPQQEAVYTIKAVCSEPGDHRIKVTVSSDDLEQLAKEESTRVYR